MIRRAVDGCYQEWLSLGRLRLKPQLDSQAHLWPRTERKALSMLLQAIKGRFEVRSSVRGNSHQVLFRLFCSYQPGGPLEQTKLLQAISDCKRGENGEGGFELDLNVAPVCGSGSRVGSNSSGCLGFGGECCSMGQNSLAKDPHKWLIG